MAIINEYALSCSKCSALFLSRGSQPNHKCYSSYDWLSKYSYLSLYLSMGEAQIKCSVYKVYVLLSIQSFLLKFVTNVPLNYLIPENACNTLWQIHLKCQETNKSWHVMWILLHNMTYILRNEPKICHILWHNPPEVSINKQILTCHADFITQYGIYFEEPTEHMLHFVINLPEILRHKQILTCRVDFMTQYDIQSYILRNEQIICQILWYVNLKYCETNRSRHIMWILLQNMTYNPQNKLKIWQILWYIHLKSQKRTDLYIIGGVIAVYNMYSQVLNSWRICGTSLRKQLLTLSNIYKYKLQSIPGELQSGIPMSSISGKFQTFS